MSDLRQAAQQALEALLLPTMKTQQMLIQRDEAIIALRRVLSQQAEPVAWMRPSKDGYDSAFRDHSTVAVCAGNDWEGWVPLYTAPPQRKPLTDEQIDAAVKAWFENPIVAGRQPFAKRMRAAIEAAHHIQEPKP